MDVDLRVATDDPTRAGVWRLRYDVFVRERKGKPPDADHVHGRLRDRLETVSTVFAAVNRQSGSVVGTIRTSPLRHGALSLYPTLYRVADLTVAPSVAASVTTYLAVASPCRRQGISTRLLQALYAHNREHGVRFDFLDCPTPLVPYFVRLGYRWQRALEHPWFGPSHLMRLSLFDTEHLTNVGSPLASPGTPAKPPAS